MLQFIISSWNNLLSAKPKTKQKKVKKEVYFVS